jgi:uncharacterized coiled-coil protein SlyX
VPTLEERVAYLEGRVGEQSKAIDGVREAVIQLDHSIHAFEERVDRRFEAVERRLGGFDGKFDSLGGKFDSLDGRIDSVRHVLEQKMSHQFVWLVGIIVTSLAAMVAALASR